MDKIKKSIMKISEKQKVIFVLVLAILAFIYSIADIINQIQLDISPRSTSWFVFIYSLFIIIVLLIVIVKDWNKIE
ncbi:hypothetical protein SAMN04487975_112123 [Planococcus glaciei]|uniref:hypothetical protein n=1 Tax=Planococcus glaciei TaxID=459472 RepID=UPI00087FD9A8|nr:hypothetical protein [Planococcus glaciei]SDI16278.1 hypothetical protein SAMN04487975_112123 [Planococcus glaciei]